MRALWLLGALSFRIALLLSLGLLLGCGGSTTGAATEFDGGSGVGARGYTHVDSGIDTQSVIALDGGLDAIPAVDLGVSVAIDSLSGIADAVKTSTFEALSDTRSVSIDARSSGSCMQQVVDNGYTSDSGSCSNPPSGVGFNTTAFATATDACQWMIACFARNSCTNHFQQTSACSDCEVYPSGGTRNAWSTTLAWLSTVVTPYCPTFFVANDMHAG